MEIRVPINTVRDQVMETVTFKTSKRELFDGHYAARILMWHCSPSSNDDGDI